VNTGAGFGGETFREQTVNTSSDREIPIVLSYSEAFHGIEKRVMSDGETIDVRIPPGARPGIRVRVRGKGQSNPFTGYRGDLYLNVELQSHPFFQFEGENLICEVPISPHEAVLGSQIQVPTPDGPVNVSVPGGIRSGQSLRLRGKGWPLAGGGRGDQLVRICIVAPKDIDPLERDCYEKIRNISTFDPRAHLERVGL